MKTRNKFLIIGSFLSILGSLLIWQTSTNSSQKNLEKEKAELSISANDLVNGFNDNEDKSDDLYSGKIIKVSGTIKDITFLNDRTTIILRTDSEDFGVICDINKNQENKLKQVYENQHITVKGICKGFLKDVILLNCTIDLPQNE